MKDKTIGDLKAISDMGAKIDVEGWVRWEGDSEPPVASYVMVDTYGLNGEYSGQAGGVVSRLHGRRLANA